jgi:hypothetical protein
MVLLGWYLDSGFVLGKLRAFIPGVSGDDLLDFAGGSSRAQWSEVIRHAGKDAGDGHSHLDAVAVHFVGRDKLAALD